MGCNVNTGHGQASRLTALQSSRHSLRHTHYTLPSEHGLMREPNDTENIFSPASLPLREKAQQRPEQAESKPLVLTTGSFLDTTLLPYIYEAQAVSQSDLSLQNPSYHKHPLYQNLTMKPLYPVSLVKQWIQLGLCTRTWVRGYLQKHGNSQVVPSFKKIMSCLVTINGLSILKEGWTLCATNDLDLYNFINPLPASEGC